MPVSGPLSPKYQIVVVGQVPREAGKEIVSLLVLFRALLVLAIFQADMNVVPDAPGCGKAKTLGPLQA